MYKKLEREIRRTIRRGEAIYFDESNMTRSRKSQQANRIKKWIEEKEMNENEVFQVELTETDIFWIVYLMNEAIIRKKWTYREEDINEVSSAYGKILNIWKKKTPIFKLQQMTAFPEGIIAWQNGKSPQQFFEEHPELLSPVPEG